MKPTISRCLNCDRPVHDAPLCETCEELFAEHDAQPVIDTLDDIRRHDAPKVPYRVLRKGRG